MPRKRAKSEQTEEQEPEATPEEIAASEAALRRWVEHAKGIPARALGRMQAFAAAVRRDHRFPDDFWSDSSSDRPPESGEALLRWLTAEVLVAVGLAREAQVPGDAVVWTNRARGLTEELREAIRLEAARLQRAENAKDRGVELVEWARAESAAHPRLSLPRICRRHPSVVAGERAWQTIRDHILKHAPDLGATRRPKRLAQAAAPAK